MCSLSLTEFDLRFNPDIFSSSVKHAEPTEEQLLKSMASSENEEQKDKSNDASAGDANAQPNENGTEEVKDVVKAKKYPSMEAQVRLNKEACDFLLLFQIPTFIRDITANRLLYISNCKLFRVLK